jgi:6-phosphofructokinase 1
MKRIGVFTSGGDSPGMNACIRAVVRTGIHLKIEVFGIHRGYKGMIRGEIQKMERTDVSNIIQLGGTILRSARSEEFRTKEGRQKAAEQLKKNGIEGLVAIGGDGTFRGAAKIFEEHSIPTIGVPGTIDNDLYGTDFAIGYDTAINTAMDAIDNIKDTANAHERVFLVEVMGRDAGFIALRAGIATGAEEVMVPEYHSNMKKIINRLKRNFKNKKNSNILVIAEGDDAGGAFEISEKLKEAIPEMEYRVTVLGHTQRGGRPTCMDRVLASRLGMEAVKRLLKGEKDVMIGQRHDRVISTPFDKAVKHHQALNPLLIEMSEILA